MSCMIVCMSIVTGTLHMTYWQRQAKLTTILSGQVTMTITIAWLLFIGSITGHCSGKDPAFLLREEWDRSWGSAKNCTYCYYYDNRLITTLIHVSSNDLNIDSRSKTAIPCDITPLRQLRGEDNYTLNSQKNTLNKLHRKQCFCFSLTNICQYCFIVVFFNQVCQTK